jgi:hypothetical protein
MWREHIGIRSRPIGISGKFANEMICARDDLQSRKSADRGNPKENLAAAGHTIA